MIKKGSDAEPKKYVFDLRLLEIQGVEKKKLNDQKEFQFDLEQIMKDFGELEKFKDDNKKISNFVELQSLRES